MYTKKVIDLIGDASGIGVVNVDTTGDVVILKTARIED